MGFAQIKDESGKVDIRMASQYSRNSGDPYVLLSPGTKLFGTQKTPGPPNTWIELSTDFLFAPRGVGLQHGRNDGHHVCNSFVIEAALDEGPWTELLTKQEQLTPQGTIYRIPPTDAAERRFSRIRIRML